MKKNTNLLILLAVPLSILALSVAHGQAACGTACTKSGTIYTCTDASFGCINDAVSAATAGDTISITATGSVNWASVLYIKKGLSLIGPGASNLTINLSACFNGNIDYSSEAGQNDTLRISGFTLNKSGGDCGVRGTIYLANNGTTKITKVIIDNNVFTDTGSVGGQAIQIRGVYAGVVHNNTFTNIAYPIRHLYGAGNSSWWDTWGPLTFGLANDNLYYEDNNFTGLASPSDHQAILTDCQFGNRYAFRYNTISSVSGDGFGPAFDMHGNVDSGTYSCFGGEIYGNSLTVGNGSSSITLLDQRGGKALVFYNSGNTSGSYAIGVREEYADTKSPTTNQPQHVTDTYHWNNRKNLTGTVAATVETADCCSAIAENTDWFQGTASFDGTAGVGCGTLASRPATCTTGVGYWATSQSCL